MKKVVLGLSGGGMPHHPPVLLLPLWGHPQPASLDAGAGHGSDDGENPETGRPGGGIALFFPGGHQHHAVF